jgi:hypothetical protein
MGFDSSLTQPASGGGVTAPTLESGLTLASAEASQDFDLVNNDGSNPSAVDLSFSSNILKAAAFDSGTASSPSYVMEASETRTISLIRGSGAPTSGDLDCTVTALLADGNTATQSVNVEALPNVFATRLGAIGAPATYQFATNSLSNSGSAGGSWTQTSGTLAAETTRTPGFAAHYIHANSTDSLTMSGLNFVNFRRDASQDRTWIQAWESNQDTYSSTSKYLSPYGDSQSTAPGGMMYVTSAGDKLYYYKDGSTSITLDTSYSHTGGGSSELLKTHGTYQSLCVVAMIWDASAATMTVRWKQEGHASGHSFYTVAAATQGTDTSWSLDLIGKGSNSSDAPNIKIFHYSVSDVAITADDFAGLLGTVGL